METQTETDSKAARAARAAYDRNMRTSPLLKLPGEIRNRIYDFLIIPNKVIYFDDLKVYNIHEDRNCELRQPIFQLQHVCKQFHLETFKMELEQSTIDMYTLHQLRSLKHFPRQNIRSVKFQMPFDGPDPSGYGKNLVSLFERSFRDNLPAVKKVLFKIGAVYPCRKGDSKRIKIWKSLKNWLLPQGECGLDVCCVFSADDHKFVGEWFGDLGFKVEFQQQKVDSEDAFDSLLQDMLVRRIKARRGTSSRVSLSRKARGFSLSADRS